MTSSRVLERMRREYGLTLVMVTHDSTVARRAQRIGLMRSGQIEIRPAVSQRGLTEDLRLRPIFDRLRAFSSCLTAVPA
jgi:ABC-type lipoprotein export system ATPase subunit